MTDMIFIEFFYFDQHKSSLKHYKCIIIFYIFVLFIKSDSPCFWAVHSSSSLWNSNTLFSCSGSENPYCMSLQWWVNRSSRTGGQMKSNPGFLWPLVFSKDDRLLSVKNVAFRLTAPWESMANIDNPFHFLPVLLCLFILSLLLYPVFLVQMTCDQCRAIACQGCLDYFFHQQHRGWVR